MCLTSLVGGTIEASTSPAGRSDTMGILWIILAVIGLIVVLQAIF
jgi:hypothetical protein